VITSQNSKNKQLCAKILDAKSMSTKRTLVSVNLSFDKDLALLKSATNAHLGIVESRIGRELSILRRKFSMRLDAFISNCRGNSSESSKESLANIVLYGLHENLDLIGRQLSDQQIYLQHPLAYDTSLIYDNPHYFLPPGEKLELPDLVSLEITNPTRQQKPQLLDEALKIFEAARLPEHQPCPELAVIPGLKTKLKGFVTHTREVSRFAKCCLATRKLRLPS